LHIPRVSPDPIFPMKRKVLPKTATGRDGPVDIAGELKVLREHLRARDEEIGTLREQMETMRDELLDRDDGLEESLHDIESTQELAGLSGDAKDRQAAYLLSIRRIRDVVGELTPRGAGILVVSKGHDSLVKFTGRKGLHFPQDESGHYPGHPTSDLGAIAHLEAMRARGANYLVLPAIALWWLDHFRKFAAHLENRYPVIHSDPETCVIFALRTAASVGAGWIPLVQAVAVHEETTGTQASVLNWDTGIDFGKKLPGAILFEPHPGQDVLPYADASIDMVAVTSPDRQRLAEARRVATTAVVIFEPAKRAGREQEFSIEWRMAGDRKAAQTAEIFCLTPDPKLLTQEWLAEFRAAFPPDFEGKFHAITCGGALAASGRKSLPRWLNVHAARNPIEVCNRLARQSTADVLLFAECGLLLLPGAIASLLGTFRGFPSAGLVGGKLLTSGGLLKELGRTARRDGSFELIGSGNWACDGPESSYVRDVAICSGSLAATPRTLFVDIGGFDNEFSVPAYALADYAAKVGTAGKRIFCQPEAVAVAPSGYRIDREAEDRCRRIFAERMHTEQPEQPPLRKQLLIASPRLPEFDRECGSKRVFDLIEILRDEWTVTFVAQDSAGADQRYVRLLQRRAVATFFAATDTIERVAAHAAFDVAILSFWQMAEGLLPALRRHSPATRVIVDSQDLHFLRTARKGLRKNSPEEPARKLDGKYGADTVRELNCYAAADAVLAVSDKETGLINDFTGDPGLTRTVPLCEDAPETVAPFRERHGILFIGNFWHQPNVEAVGFLCREIIPLLDPALLARHPVTIVGHQLDNRIREFARGLAHVRMVGWVPTLEPYLRSARVSAVPLLHGAGTKGKVIQSLMHGLPVVTTHIGAEGLGLHDREHALIADDPEALAAAITELLTKGSLWASMSRAGREHISKSHGRCTVKARLDEVIEQVRLRAPLPAQAQVPAPGASRADYAAVVASVREAVTRTVPEGRTAAVITKGDGNLLVFGSRQGWHFPLAENGAYAGHHPRDSAAAITHLESLRAKGCEFLVIPSTAFWWLDHYADFRTHLATNCREVLREPACLIFALGETSTARNGAAGQATVAAPEPSRSPEPLDAATIEQFRPRIPADVKRHVRALSVDKMKVLILGIYLANKPNNAADTIAVLADSSRHDVTQGWIGLGGPAPTDGVAAVTVRTIEERIPKFQLLNDLIAAHDLAAFDYVLLVDDDVILPNHFVDSFISFQHTLGFALAQPARTANSYTDHPIVEQQPGVLARQTRFVEIGPVVSFYRSVFENVLPFDTSNEMGWGYENAWARALAERGIKAGIIDALPVDHSIRKPVEHYDWGTADAQRTAYLAEHPHFTYDECFHVLDIVTL